MLLTCRVYENDQKLGQDAEVPTTNISRIRQLNDRTTDAAAEAAEVTQAKDVESPREEPASDQRRLEFSALSSAHMLLHKNTGHTVPGEDSNQSYEVENMGNTVKVAVRDQQWEQEEKGNTENLENGILIGKLSEEVVLDHVRRKGNVSVRYALPKGGFVHLCTREVDGFHRQSSRFIPVEVKGVGKLKSYKPKFFNTRLYSLVAKAIATGAALTYVVVRDDCKMNLDKGELGAIEVLLWEDVTRLSLPGQLALMKKAHEENIKSLASDGILSCTNEGSCVKFNYSNNRMKKNKCEAEIPMKKLNKKFNIKANVRHHVVVGPDIPYFDFKLNDVYLTCKHQHADKGWRTSKIDKIHVVANSWEDIMIIFEKYERYASTLDVTFYTKKSFKDTYSQNLSDLHKLCSKFKREDKLEEKEYNNYSGLGEALFKRELTHWKDPIPKVLLLLGEGQHVPNLLITARLSFGVLTKADGTYTTGIDLKDVPYPDKIAILGNDDECKAGVELTHNAFPDREPVGLSSSRNKYLPGQSLPDKYNNLATTLKSMGFPMYKEFHHKDGEWKAE